MEQLVNLIKKGKVWWSSVKKVYRRVRRKIIESKKSARQIIRWIISPYLAVRFIIEQVAWGHFPVLDKNMFMTDSILERWLYYDIRSACKGKIIPQYPIGPYWADFALPEIKLVIELDGYKYHKNRIDEDRRRNAYMYRKGWKVMRFTYNDVRKNRARTIEKVLGYINSRLEKERNG
ncbi:MAG: DUF559 domain-containing protein [Thermoactinomyces sp.]